jgi:hypothetical protein
MLILSTQERKYETKTFNENFAKKVRTCRFLFSGNVKLKLLNNTCLSASQKCPVETNARPVNNSPSPGQLCKYQCPATGQRKGYKCPGVARGVGGWAMLELTDA